MAKTNKYYVVWKGRKPGIYNSWDKCKEQVDHFFGARYKSFTTEAEATRAFSEMPGQQAGTASSPAAVAKTFRKRAYITPALAVDAACSGVPGPVEWQGVLLGDNTKVFRSPVYLNGTNNIGEFLAIVDGIKWLIAENKNSEIPIYSDSNNAILWVKKKRCKTTLVRTMTNKPLFELIKQAEQFLENTDKVFTIKKWDTEAWGENPADFGRK